MNTAACRLYLATPAAFDPATLAVQLAAALDAGDIGCVLLRLTADDAAVAAAARRLLPIVHGHDVAMLLEGRPELAARLGFDGVHIGAGDDYAAARKALGDARTVGVACGSSRHDAMLAAEAGADYVAFSGPGAAELAAWWAALMTVPSVAEGDPAALSAAGADFVRVSDAVWQHPAGAASAIAALNTAIAPGTAA